MGLEFGATDNRLLLASKWQAGCLLSQGATDKLVCPCGTIASDRMLARPRKPWNSTGLFLGRIPGHHPYCLSVSYSVDMTISIPPISNLPQTNLAGWNGRWSSG
jgi:hypothetical protein